MRSRSLAILFLLTARGCGGAPDPGPVDSATEKAAESGKPAEIVAKMVDGSVAKFLKEVSLLNQVFVKAADGKQTVEQMLKGVNTKVKAFTLYVVGEGIEKKVDDFAAEVAAQVAAAKGQ